MTTRFCFSILLSTYDVLIALLSPICFEVGTFKEEQVMVAIPPSRVAQVFLVILKLGIFIFFQVFRSMAHECEDIHGQSQ